LIEVPPHVGMRHCPTARPSAIPPDRHNRLPATAHDQITEVADFQCQMCRYGALREDDPDTPPFPTNSSMKSSTKKGAVSRPSNIDLKP
jgi:hypothetical protein